MKAVLIVVFVFLLAMPAYVHATNYTLFPGTRPLIAPFPTGGRFIETTAPTTRREISPGEFDANSVVAAVRGNDTDAAQWRPNQTIANTTASQMISSAGNANHALNNVTKLSAGWLWNSTDLRGLNLSTSVQSNGNWSLRFTLRSGQGTSGTESILGRISVVRNVGGTLILIKDLLTRRITGAATADNVLSAGLLGWRDTDFTISHPTGTATDTQYNVQIGPTNESYVFEQGDAIYFEFGFDNADSTTDRTLTMVYNASITNITTPWFEPVNLTTNGSLTNQPVRMYTGETTIFTGNCAVLGGTAKELDIRIQDNRTGSFTNSTADTTAAVYVNVTNYTVADEQGDTAGFTFLVNASAPGNYSFRTQCESATTINMQANSSDAPSTLFVSQAVGYLNVTLETPTAGSTNINQNTTFGVNATVVCVSNSSNPTAICGAVNGSARRNTTSGGQPILNIPFGSGTPFHSILGNENQTCGQMNTSSGILCQLNWTINATGIINSNWTLDVNFTTNQSGVTSNSTTSFVIIITGAVAVDVSFTLAIPGTNATVFTASGQTATTIIFNSTSVIILQLNATAVGGAQQSESIPIFNFTNTGNVAVNITGNFTDNVPGGVEAKIGWAAGAYQDNCTASNSGPPSTAACSNLTYSSPYPQVMFANMSTSGAAKYREVWLWVDYNSVTAGTDTTVNLLFNSTAG